LSYRQKSTVTVAEVVAAVELLLPPHLAKHTVAAIHEAVGKHDHPAKGSNQKGSKKGHTRTHRAGLIISAPRVERLAHDHIARPKVTKTDSNPKSKGARKGRAS